MESDKENRCSGKAHDSNFARTEVLSPASPECKPPEVTGCTVSTIVSDFACASVAGEETVKTTDSAVSTGEDGIIPDSDEEEGEAEAEKYPLDEYNDGTTFTFMVPDEGQIFAFVEVQYRDPNRSIPGFKKYTAHYRPGETLMYNKANATSSENCGLVPGCDIGTTVDNATHRGSLNDGLNARPILITGVTAYDYETGKTFIVPDKSKLYTPRKRNLWIFHSTERFQTANRKLFEAMVEKLPDCVSFDSTREYADWSQFNRGVKCANSHFLVFYEQKSSYNLNVLPSFEVLMKLTQSNKAADLYAERLMTKCGKEGGFPHHFSPVRNKNNMFRQFKEGSQTIVFCDRLPSDYYFNDFHLLDNGAEQLRYFLDDWDIVLLNEGTDNTTVLSEEKDQQFKSSPDDNEGEIASLKKCLDRAGFSYWEHKTLIRRLGSTNEAAKGLLRFWLDTRDKDHLDAIADTVAMAYGPHYTSDLSTVMEETRCFLKHSTSMKTYLINKIVYRVAQVYNRYRVESHAYINSFFQPADWDLNLKNGCRFHEQCTNGCYLNVTTGDFDIVRGHPHYFRNY